MYRYLQQGEMEKGRMAGMEETVVLEAEGPEIVTDFVQPL